MLTKFKSNYVKDRRNQTISILQPMIEQGHRPDRGWISTYTLNGVPITLPGSKPIEVVGALRDLMKSNRIDHTEAELWTTLNLDWLSRTNAKFHKISMVDFVAECVSEEKETKESEVDVSLWLPQALDTLGFSLCVSDRNYRYEDFDNLIRIVLRLTDVGVHLKLGSRKANSSMLELYSVISYTPCRVLDEARERFVNVYNVLSPIIKTAPISKATATTKYHW